MDNRPSLFYSIAFTNCSLPFKMVLIEDAEKTNTNDKTSSITPGELRRTYY